MLPVRAAFFLFPMTCGGLSSDSGPIYFCPLCYPVRGPYPNTCPYVQKGENFQENESPTLPGVFIGFITSLSFTNLERRMTTALMRALLSQARPCKTHSPLPRSRHGMCPHTFFGFGFVSGWPRWWPGGRQWLVGWLCLASEGILVVFTT